MERTDIDRHACPPLPLDDCRDFLDAFGSPQAGDVGKAVYTRRGGWQIESVEQRDRRLAGNDSAFAHPELESGR